MPCRVILLIVLLGLGAAAAQEPTADGDTNGDGVVDAAEERAQQQLHDSLVQAAALMEHGSATAKEARPVISLPPPSPPPPPHRRRRLLPSPPTRRLPPSGAARWLQAATEEIARMAIITTIDQPFHPVTYRNAAIKATSETFRRPQRRQPCPASNHPLPPNLGGDRRAAGCAALAHRGRDGRCAAERARRARGHCDRRPHHRPRQ